MTVSDPPRFSIEELTRQFVENLSTGATIGDMLGLEESDLEVVYTLGHSLYLQGKFEDSTKLFGFLVSRSHRERRYVKAFASSLQMMRDYGNAIRMYTLASVMDLSDPTPCFHTCECLIAMGLRAEAEEGLAMVVHQAEDTGLAEIAARARGLLALLAKHCPSPARETS